ncbi:hypothetical protein [Spirosoma flavum]|uniref:PilZ domain-containing protein n=1 Tax=Spirosoma flavum TaxID=2048557 RepID=A0ABW6APG3_9BACT
MSLINQVYEIHLGDLFGPNATVTDVEYDMGMINFSLPIRESQDFIMPVNCQISGIYDGKLECLITESELEAQLQFRTKLKIYAKDFFKKLDEQDSKSSGDQG